MLEYSDVVNLTRDELLQEYCKLYDRFQELSELNELDTQKIHELKRSLDTATAAQAYLSQELEQYVNFDNKDIEKDLHKTLAELVEMKKKYVGLQEDYSVLLVENSKISKYVEKTLNTKTKAPSESDSKPADEDLLQIKILANENEELLAKVVDFEERSVQHTRTIAEYEKNIQILRDKVVCLEENLQSKRIDLEETLQILESTQEQLAEANLKIAMLSAAPDDNDRKGNSLFAEVDDQRQAMKQLLKAQKKSYMEMKKVYNESEYEIRRLKRENISIHTELEACTSIFCNADKIYQERLNERIHNLMNQSESLECKLKWTQERLKELADDRGVLFLNSMLNFCKRETDDLKSQLHSARIQKACLEEQLRNAQQDMARWRFESLKSRCVLIDREHLLNENKIAFKPIQALEYNITGKDQEEAKPRIVTKRRSSIYENFINRKSLTPSEVPEEQNKCSPQQNAKDISSLNTQNIKEELKEQSNINDKTDILSKNEEKPSEKELSCTEMKEIAYEKVDSAIVNNIELNKNENMDHNTTGNIDENPELNKFSKLRAEHTSPMRPSQKSLETATPKTSGPSARSILTKQTDFLTKDSSKNVKFSAEGDIVHDISLETLDSVGSTDANSVNSILNNTNRIKKCSKSNIVVRRVVVRSKHD